jgi:hypothetical protein
MKKFLIMIYRHTNTEIQKKIMKDQNSGEFVCFSRHDNDLECWSFF